jgi:hypothetical protein
MVAGALVSLGAAVWLLLVAVARQSGGVAYVVGSLLADAVSFGFLVAALARHASRDGSSPHPARA